MDKITVKRMLKNEARNVGRYLWCVDHLRNALACREAAYSILAMGTEHMSPDVAKAVEEIQGRITLFIETAKELDTY